MDTAPPSRLSLPWLKILKTALPFLVMFVALISAWNNVAAKQTAIEKDLVLLTASTHKKDLSISKTIELLRAESGFINQKLASIETSVKHIMRSNNRIEDILIGGTFKK